MNISNLVERSISRKFQKKYLKEITQLLKPFKNGEFKATYLYINEYGDLIESTWLGSLRGLNPSGQTYAQSAFEKYQDSLFHEILEREVSDLGYYISIQDNEVNLENGPFGFITTDGTLFYDEGQNVIAESEEELKEYQEETGVFLPVVVTENDSPECHYYFKES
jgi:hypothetical protein